MKLKQIHRQVESSDYKPWQVYFLALSLVASIGLYFKFGLIISLLQAVEGATANLEWLVVLGIQGILIGFVAELLYEQGDNYAKSASNLFGSKDRTLFFRIGVITGISAVITIVVPTVLENTTEYPVIQTAGAVIALGILLVHQGSNNWNARTEWPAIIAGLIIAIIPSFT